MDITKREITKIAREVNKFTARVMRDEGIGTAEYDVIHAIRKNPGITQSGVCKVTGLDQGAVARQTANLETKGYLVRKENPFDGRSRFLFATPKADQLKNSKARVEALFYEWLCASLTDDEAASFSRILDVLYQKCKTESKKDFPTMSNIMEGANKNAE